MKITYDDAFVWRLFGRRCVQCKLQIATELNHIVPRSEDRSKIVDWKNKVPMCHTCHTEYHSGGVTQEKIEALQKVRADRLTDLGMAVFI
jgi:5-methylcytosine-specific restriction endonuclease McrA